MRIFTISAEIKLLTLNKAFVALKNGRRVRSKEYVKFAREIARVKLLLQSQFKLFDDSFEPKKQEIHATLRMGTPDLYTKAGTISKNSLDLANCEKCLVDNVLTGKINDAYITNWEMSKFESPIYEFALTFEIVER